VGREFVGIDCYSIVIDLTPKSPLLKKERGLVDEIEQDIQRSFNC